MSRTSVVTVTWTCDACGYEALEVDGYAPRKWQQVAQCSINAQLGNFPARHLCEDCAETLTRLLDHRLGDTGDMAIAWDEGAIWAGAVALDGVVSHDNPYAPTLAPTANGDRNE